MDAEQPHDKYLVAGTHVAILEHLASHLTHLAYPLAR
jgi:hypothetical protein